MRRFVVAMVVAVVLVGSMTACDPAVQVQATGGTGQITVRTAPNATVELRRNGQVVPTYEVAGSGDPVPVNRRQTDARGWVVLRYVPTGSGYTVHRVDSDETLPSEPVAVRGVLHRPPASFYEKQKLPVGYGYLRTRDNTFLSYMIRLPGPPEKGPYPTVIEYSGYEPANPEWGGTTASARIASLLGYATVGVNIRGTGCSGGSFQLWEDAQITDGYDVVETIAAQPWVKGNKVGLVGLSYPGNAALYAASAQPPSLSAVAIGGTYDDGFRNLLRPSGIVNSGFARSWIEGREAEAEPNGQGWTRKRIAAGDEICAAHQRLRTQNVDLGERIDTNPYFPTILDLGDSFALSTIVDRIKVPVLNVATWQDEQVGGHVPTMIPNFTGTTKDRWILANGGHAEMFAVPDIIHRWHEFLELYVKRAVPNSNTLKLIAPFVATEVIGPTTAPTSTLPFPSDRFTGRTFAQALAAYEREPRVRVLFENGGGRDVEPGMPREAFAVDVGAYPVPGTTPDRWFLGPDGTLVRDVPEAADDAPGSIDDYVSDPSVRPRTSTTGGGDWAQFPAYDWRAPVADKGLSYTSAPLSEDTTMIGSGSVDLWLRSSAPETDLQVTLTEVRPDGKEMYVQSGWLRTTVRKVDEARSTDLQPLLTMREEDAAPLPAGEFTPVRVEIYPFGHVFREGSQIRVIVTAPGGDRIAWAFDTLPATQTNEVARSVGRPSSVALPVVPGIDVPTGLPACPGVRAQPCRTAVPFAN